MLGATCRATLTCTFASCCCSLPPLPARLRCARSLFDASFDLASFDFFFLPGAIQRYQITRSPDHSFCTENPVLPAKPPLKSRSRITRVLTMHQRAELPQVNKSVRCTSQATGGLILMLDWCRDADQQARGNGLCGGEVVFPGRRRCTCAVRLADSSRVH